MKILYVSQFYYPERAAGAFRAIDNSIIWSKYNHDITVFTTYPNFPKGEIFTGYSNKLLSKDTYKGVKLIRNKIIASKNTRKLNRFISSGSFVIYSLYNIFFKSDEIGKDYDIVLGTSGTILAPIIAYVFSRKNKIPLVLELRDITYHQILAVYKGKEKLLYSIVKIIELYLCKRADKIVVVSNGFRDILVKDGIDKNKISVIENGAYIKEFKMKTENKIKNKIKNKITFSYIGNIGGSQNLKKIVDIFELISFENIEKELIFIGDGGKKEELILYVNSKDIQNITILDGMDYEDLDSYYKKSDFCIVSLNNNDKFVSTIPSKIFILMSKSKPIIFFGPKGEASNIIRKSNCGIVYNEKDYKKIAKDLSKRINYYNSNKRLEEVCKKYGELGYDFVNKNYNRETLAKKYIELLKTIIEK